MPEKLSRFLKLNKSAVPENLTPAVIDPPIYPWNRNSCWLDTSLQLLYIAVIRHLDDFTSIHNGLPEKSPLKVVFASLLQRQNMDLEGNSGYQTLRNQRDKICMLLKQNKAIKSVSHFESLFVCILMCLSIIISLTPKSDMVFRDSSSGRY